MPFKATYQKHSAKKANANELSNAYFTPMKFSFIVLLTTCCGALSTNLSAQSIDPAARANIPSYSKKKLRRLKSDGWQVPGYTLVFSNLFSGYGTTDKGTEVFLLRYPESDMVTSRIELEPSNKRLSGSGAYSYISPDRREFVTGHLVNNKPAGEWLSVTIDTAICRILEFDTPFETALSLLKDCAKDSATQSQISVDRATYQHGKLSGEASSIGLDGVVHRTVRYALGEPIGDELIYREGELFQTIKHTPGRADTTYAQPGYLDSLRSIAYNPNTPKERMPAFASTNCPTIELETSSKEEVIIYQKCATQAMLEHIYTNIKYPVTSRRLGIEGTAVVTFVVERDGELSHIRTARFVSAPIDAEALRVIKSMPRWNPGYQAGNPVRVQFNLPIAFRLN